MSSYEETFDLRGHLYNEAMALCPQARAAELSEVIDWLTAQAGTTICDAPAGGGYVADGLRTRFGPRVRVLCVEPSKNFASAIGPSFEVFNEPLHATSIAAGSVDSVVSLAGLHHLDDKPAVFHEWARVLKSGGRCAVADVLAGSGPAAFLNEFVNAFTPGGHEGLFPTEGDFSSWLGASGFSDLREQTVCVPWTFPDEQTLSVFCQRLFGITKTEPAHVLAALREHVGVEAGAAGAQLNWSLRYASGRKI